MDVVVLAFPANPGAGLDGVGKVGRHQAASPRDHAVQRVRAEGGSVRPRVDALQEQRLTGPHRADAGEVALVEQGRADRAGEIGDGLLLVEAGTEDVRAEVADEGALLAGADEVEHAQPEPGRRPLLGDQQSPDVVGAASAAVEALPAARVSAASCGDGGRVGGRTGDAPLPLHLQMGVQRPAGVKALQDVLATRHDLRDHLAHQIGRGQPRPAQVRGNEHPSSERLVQSGAGTEDGVALWHG